MKVRYKIRSHRNRRGWVCDYEWDWNSHTFPVYVEDIGVRTMNLNDIEVISDLKPTQR